MQIEFVRKKARKRVFTHRDDVHYGFDYLMWDKGYTVEDRETVRKRIESMDNDEIERLHRIDTDSGRIEAIEKILYY